MMKRTFALILTLVMILSCAGCAEKTPQTLDGFTAIMEQAGYTVEDTTSENEYEGVELTVLYAGNDKLAIEFYEFKNASHAVQYYAAVKENIEDFDHSSYASVSMGSFSKFECTTDIEFCCVARIDNTVILMGCDKDYTEAAKSLIETLGYN
jgi:hypothetical protein